MEASVDLAGLINGPVIAIIVLTAIITAMIGYAAGRANENKRKLAELKQADDAAKVTLEDLKQDHEQKITILNKAHANDLEQLKQEQSAQIDQVNQAHQSLVDSLKEGHNTEVERIGREHNTLVKQLNETNNAHLNELKQEQQRQITELDERSSKMVEQLEARRKSEIAELKQENAQAIDSLKREHREAMESLRTDHQTTISALRQDSEQAISEAKQRHTKDVKHFNQQIDQMAQELDTLNVAISEYDETIGTLQAQIKESKMNNMFSVSKSGDKLIRVVRSVQELANELDETSRAVTNGEYSFFDQIKDQRDKETVLSLTGGDRGYHDEPHVADETTIDVEPVSATDDQPAAQETPDRSE